MNIDAETISIIISIIEKKIGEYDKTVHDKITQCVYETINKNEENINNIGDTSNE